MEGAPASGEAKAGKSGKVVPEPAFDPNSFKDDPLIKQALEIFKGQIVTVRS
jgi:hypothetical protein